MAPGYKPLEPSVGDAQCAFDLEQVVPVALLLAWRKFSDDAADPVRELAKGARNSSEFRSSAHEDPACQAAGNSGVRQGAASAAAFFYVSSSVAFTWLDLSELGQEADRLRLRLLSSQRAVP